MKPVAKKGAAKPAPKKESSESEEEEKPVVTKKPVVAAKPAKQAPKPAPVEAEEKSEMVDENDEEGVFEVCVRGLSFQAYDSDIRDLFETCGEVLEVKLLTRDDGKSKGTAFVKFSKKSAFNKALELNGTEHLGRNLTIEESQGKKPFNNNGGSFGGNQRGGFGQNQRGGNFGGNQGGKNYPQPGSANIETPTLFIGGLSYNSTADSIKDFFSQVGDVSSARVVTDKETGKVLIYLFSLVVSDILNSMTSIPLKKPTLSLMEPTSTAETSALTVLPKETGPRAVSEEASEDKEDREVSVATEEALETLETQQLY